MTEGPPERPRRTAAIGLLVVGLALAYWVGTRTAPREVPVTLRLEGDRESTAHLSVTFETEGESLGGATWSFPAKAPLTLTTHPKLPRRHVSARVEMRSRDNEVRLNAVDLDAEKDEVSLRISLDFSRQEEKPQRH